MNSVISLLKAKVVFKYRKFVDGCAMFKTIATAFVLSILRRDVVFWSFLTLGQIELVTT